jgi:hypothetical protein
MPAAYLFGSRLLFFACGIRFIFILVLAVAYGGYDSHGASSNDENKPAVLEGVDPAPDKEDNHRKNRNHGVQGFPIHIHSLLVVIQESVCYPFF